MTAALWDLNFSGPPPSDSLESYSLPPSRASHRPPPPRAKVRRSAFVRLTQLPQHRQSLAVSLRHMPHPDILKLGRAGGVRDAAIRELVATPPVVDERLGRKGQPEWAGGARTTEQNALLRVFRWLDANSDGFVDAAELHKGQRLLGGHLPFGLVADLLWEVDDDLDGKLSYDDFVDAFYRSRKDSTGFEPRRFFFMVEFFLMDRNLSGEVTLDDAMSAIFQRYGSQALSMVSHNFYAAAGYHEGKGEEPPPNATVTFDAFFRKFALAKPKVRAPHETARSYSEKVLPLIQAAQESDKANRLQASQKQRQRTDSVLQEEESLSGRAESVPKLTKSRSSHKDCAPSWDERASTPHTPAYTRSTCTRSKWTRRKLDSSQSASALTRVPRASTSHGRARSPAAPKELYSKRAAAQPSLDNLSVEVDDLAIEPDARPVPAELSCPPIGSASEGERPMA